MRDDDMPCGRCEVGIYSYASCVTPLAYALAAAPAQERQPPRCKTMNRDCVGACHFIQAINADPEVWEQIVKEQS